MTRQARLALKYGLPLLIIAGFAGLTYYFISQREKPQREEQRTERVLVEATSVERATHRLDVRASGTVIAAREVTVSPQVGGRLEYVNPNLVPGGILEAGDVIARIDDSDYRIAVKQRKTALEQARAQLAIEKGQQDIAQKEWELFKDEIENGSDGPSALALRKPQLRSTKAQVDAAQAQLEQARLNLSRTTLRAPFDAVVLQEQADLGQLVGTQSSVATLVGTDRFWIRVSVPADEVNNIRIPDVNAEDGSKAHVSYDLGSRTIERTGRVVRLLGDLDPAGRMAQVLVEIEDPLALEGHKKGSENLRGIPLLLDAFVDVRLEGDTQRKLVELPRGALRNGDQAYVYADGKLEIRDLEIVWRRPDSVLVDDGLEDGERVVTSPIATPVAGMTLRLPDAGPEEAKPGDASPETDDTDDTRPTGNTSNDSASEEGAARE